MRKVNPEYAKAIMALPTEPRILNCGHEDM